MNNYQSVVKSYVSLQDFKKKTTFVAKLKKFNVGRIELKNTIVLLNKVPFIAIVAYGVLLHDCLTYNIESK